MAAFAMASSLAFAQSPSPNGVKTLAPPGAIKTEGTWSLGARAGDFIFVAGMPGIDPVTNRMVMDPEGQIRQAFLNIRTIAQSEGASLQDCVRITVYLSDLNRFAPLVDKAQTALWGKPPYPPRTMVEVQRLFDDMIVPSGTVSTTAAGDDKWTLANSHRIGSSSATRSLVGWSSTYDQALF
jgi:enamine deaminase RidA (YjgF/YER057c/UK114 family)